MSRRLLVLACLLGTLGLSGCGEATDTEKRLRAALAGTEQLAHTFVYSETFRAKDVERETEVQGLVEDDFRYKARVLVDGAPVLDEAVSDDALAVRFVEPARLADFARRATRKVGRSEPGAPEAPVGDSNRQGPDPIAALRTRRWVLDQAGAPAVVGGGVNDERLVGEDPILDALDVFTYVERAIDEAVRIVEYNEESLEYRRSEDPFPRPEKGSKVIRYDFERPKLPRAADTTGGNQVTPDTRHFRKMSVYVKGGRVVQIREKIDVESRLEDLAKVYETKFPEGVSPAALEIVAVDALNAIRTGQGSDPIRLRSMVFKLADVGDDVKVDMPTDVVETSLAVLQNRGRPADTAAGAALAAGLAGQPTG